ncbi:MAG TPA: hypothetical protein VMT16_13085 [Thermoanaerobaculia bacterium]|nr:hypothetical protein [Thermoanaerobaculia bacterium]
MQLSIRRRDRRWQGGAAASSIVLLFIALLAAPRPAAAEPGYFGLSAPAHNTAITFDTSFSWASSNNATEYYVEIKRKPRPNESPSSSWESIPVGNSTSWKPPWNPDTLDYMAGREIDWRVRACQPSEPDPAKRCRYGNTGGTGEPTPRLFKVPLFPAQLSSPASGQVTGLQPTFEWLGSTTVGGLPVTFRVKVNGSLVACQQAANQKACTPTSPLLAGTHRWWVEQCITLGGTSVCGEPPQATKRSAPNQRIHEITTIGGATTSRSGR